MKLKILIWMLISGLTIVGLSASPEPREVTVKKSVKEQIEAVTQAHDKKAKVFMEQLRLMRDRKKAKEMYRTGRPAPTEAAHTILKLAKENPKAEGIEKGLTWILKRAASAHCKEAANILLAHYKGAESMAALSQYYGNLYRGGEPELRKIIKTVNSEQVRQGASYYLAKKLIKTQKNKQEGLVIMKNLVATFDPNKGNPRMIAQVKEDIIVTEKLGIGCTAPDIVGKDHEGKEFKLSDYRGQVVLLDFWGIW